MSSCWVILIFYLFLGTVLQDEHKVAMVKRLMHGIRTVIGNIYYSASLSIAWGMLSKRHSAIFQGRWSLIWTIKHVTPERERVKLGAVNLPGFIHMGYLKNYIICLHLGEAQSP